MGSSYVLLVIYLAPSVLVLYVLVVTVFSSFFFFLFCFFVDFELLGFNMWFEFEIAELVSSVLLRLTTL